MSVIDKRYDFVLLYDCELGNPSGDTDAGNQPRIDPETGHGVVTDVCLKRKIRNFVLLNPPKPKGYDIFVKEKSVLNTIMEQAFHAAGVNLQADKDADGKKRKEKGKAQGSEVETGRKKMCETFFDVRTFGAVMSTGPNAGQVRGPVQLTFGRSIDPIVPLEHSITRCAVATVEEAEAQGGDNRTMGRKNTIPYGLYRTHGFISPSFAAQTDFSSDDLALLEKALVNLFEDDRSAARGMMATRKLFIFEHNSKLGNAPAHVLFDKVKVRRKDESKPPRSFSDYVVEGPGDLPQGVTCRVLP